MEKESFMSMISISDNLWSDDMIDVTSKSFTRMADIIQQQVKKNVHKYYIFVNVIIFFSIPIEIFELNKTPQIYVQIVSSY